MSDIDDNCDPDALAADYALGVMTPEERLATQARSGTDPRLGRAIAEWERRLAPLASGVAEIPPPPGLFAAIEARIERQHDALAGTFTRLAEARRWRTIGPGLSVSVLSSNEAGRQTMLLRCDPGAVYPSHDHDGDEELFLIEGDIVMGELELKAGDYHFAPRGRPHPSAHTRTGCLLLVIAGA